MAAKSMPSDTAILTHIARQPKRQAGYKQLVRELGLHGEERHDLEQRLQKLIKSGHLIPVDSDRYALPQAAADKNLIAGRLSMTISACPSLIGLTGPFGTGCSTARRRFWLHVADIVRFGYQA